MGLDPGAVVVVGMYALALVVVLYVSPRVTGPSGARPWWRNVRFWASFVAVVQMLVYALWG